MALDEQGKEVWQRQLDIYGKTRNLEGESSLIPFLYQGQYYDEETGLAYNRFRYYSPDSGTYLSQDPIGLLGNNPNLYAYVHDTNNWVDPFGLDLHHIIPQKVYKLFKDELKSIKGYVQNVSKKAKDVSNLIDLDKPFHGNHPKYSVYVEDRIRKLLEKNNGKIDSKDIRKLQDELREHIANAKKSGMKLNDYFKKGLHLTCKK